jgi:hypothetical protein
MSFLLPQDRAGTLEGVREVNLHGDRWLDLVVAFDGDAAAQALRLAATECPAGLAPGERVSVRVVMGVATAIRRA